jgi:PEP-CTERM motif-containing protein
MTRSRFVVPYLLATTFFVFCRATFAASPFDTGAGALAAYYLGVDNVSIKLVPEPQSYLLIGSGLLALLSFRRLRRNRA